MDLAGSIMADQLDASSQSASSTIFDRRLTAQQSTSSIPANSDYNPYDSGSVTPPRQISPVSTTTGSTSIEAHDPWMSAAGDPSSHKSSPKLLDETQEGFNPPSTPPAPVKRHVEFGDVMTFEEEPRKSHYLNGSNGSTKLPTMENYEATAHPVKVCRLCNYGNV